MANADVPKLDGLFPAGGAAGSSFAVESVGSNPAGTRWWSDVPGLNVVPSEGDQRWTVAIPEATPVGLYRICSYNDEGCSGMRFFSVGRFREMTEEEEPNDGDGARQAVGELPACLNGRLEKTNDVDGYSVALESGQSLVGLVEAYALGSPVDPLIHIVNPRGERVFTAMDSRNLDPIFAFEAPESGEYTVQIAGFGHPPEANVNYTGNARTIYRLHLSTGPVVTHFHPCVAPIGEPVTVTLQGYNLPGDGRSVELTPDDVQYGDGGILLVRHPDAPLPIQAVGARGTISEESEPNDSREAANAVGCGVVGGQFQSEGDVDYYVVELAEGETLEARVVSQRIGLPGDAELGIENPSGERVASNADSDGGNDPRVQWTAKTAGPHRIAVSETMGRHGPGHHYVLEVGRPEPSIALESAGPASLTLKPGSRETIKVSVKRRNGMDRPFALGVEALPAGVRVAEVPAPEKDGEAELVIEVASNAPPFQGMIYPVAWLPDDRPDGADGPLTYRTMRVPVPLRGDLRRGTSLLDDACGLWLTVRP